MQKILDFMFKSVVSLSEYDRYMILLDMRDNEGKTAIQYASEYDRNTPHHIRYITHITSARRTCFTSCTINSTIEIRIAPITYHSCSNTIRNLKTSNSLCCSAS
jgi:hypothetical protein